MKRSVIWSPDAAGALLPAPLSFPASAWDVDEGAGSLVHPANTVEAIIPAIKRPVICFAFLITNYLPFTFSCCSFAASLFLSCFSTVPIVQYFCHLVKKPYLRKWYLSLIKIPGKVSFFTIFIHYWESFVPDPVFR